MRVGYYVSPRLKLEHTWEMFWGAAMLPFLLGYSQTPFLPVGKKNHKDKTWSILIHLPA